MTFDTVLLDGTHPTSKMLYDAEVTSADFEGESFRQEATFLKKSHFFTSK